MNVFLFKKKNFSTHGICFRVLIVECLFYSYMNHYWKWNVKKKKNLGNDTFYDLKKKNLVWFWGEMDIISIKRPRLRVSAQLDISIWLIDNSNNILIKYNFFPFKCKFQNLNLKYVCVYSWFIYTVYFYYYYI